LTFRTTSPIRKDEDYRWAILRTIIPPWLFQIFNLTFIAIIQNILLFMLAVSRPLVFLSLSYFSSHHRLKLPAHQVLLQPRTSLPLSYADYTLTALSLLTLLLEFISDNQQYSYQTFKQTDKINENEWWGARIKWTKEDKERGFVTRGLWSLSRHPNFLCEQTVG
jgi:steroid 5-alpha reductase family enzyme